MKEIEFTGNLCRRKDSEIPFEYGERKIRRMGGLKREHQVVNVETKRNRIKIPSNYRAREKLRKRTRTLASDVGRKEGISLLLLQEALSSP